MSETKLITCCYCGARDAMRVGKGQRRTLSCLTCGAPIRRIETVRAGKTPKPFATPERINQHQKPGWHEAAMKRKKKKRKKGLFAALLDGADDVFDIGDILDFD